MDFDRVDVDVLVSALQFIQKIQFLLFLSFYLDLLLWMLFILLSLLSYALDRFKIVRHVLAFNNHVFPAAYRRLTLVS